MTHEMSLSETASAPPLQCPQRGVTFSERWYVCMLIREYIRGYVTQRGANFASLGAQWPQNGTFSEDGGPMICDLGRGRPRASDI